MQAAVYTVTEEQTYNIHLPHTRSRSIYRQVAELAEQKVILLGAKYWSLVDILTETAKWPRGEFSRDDYIEAAQWATSYGDKQLYRLIPVNIAPEYEGKLPEAIEKVGNDLSSYFMIGGYSVSTSLREFSDEGITSKRQSFKQICDWLSAVRALSSYQSQLCVICLLQLSFLLYKSTLHRYIHRDTIHTVKKLDITTSLWLFGISGLGSCKDCHARVHTLQVLCYNSKAATLALDRSRTFLMDMFVPRFDVISSVEIRKGKTACAFIADALEKLSTVDPLLKGYCKQYLLCMAALFISEHYTSARGLHEVVHRTGTISIHKKKKDGVATVYEGEDIGTLVYYRERKKISRASSSSHHRSSNSSSSAMKMKTKKKKTIRKKEGFSLGVTVTVGTSSRPRKRMVRKEEILLPHPPRLRSRKVNGERKKMKKKKRMRVV